MRYFHSSFLYSESFHSPSSPTRFLQRALPCRNTVLTRFALKNGFRLAQQRRRLKLYCLAVKYGENFDLRTFVASTLTNKYLSLRGRNKECKGYGASTLKKLLKVLAFSKSLENTDRKQSFIQALQKGQRNKQEQRISQERKEQLIYFAHSVGTSRLRRSKVVYFLIWIMFLVVSFFFVVPQRQYMCSKSVDWIWLVCRWERHFEPFLSFAAPIFLLTYTFFFPLSFCDTYRRYLLSYFLVLFAQGIASMFSIAGFESIRLGTEIVLNGIYIPIVLWAWADLKVELEMAYIIDKRYSFVFTFWRILRTFCCCITTFSGILAATFSNKSLSFRNERLSNALRNLLGFSLSPNYYWKRILLSRVGLFLLYCYILYSLLFFTVFVDCGSEFYSRHDYSPFTRFFLYLGLLDRNLTKGEASKKGAAWKGFFETVDKKLGRLPHSEEHSVDIRDSSSYPLAKQIDVFSFIARFKVPWDDETELRDEVLLPFRQYLDNVELAIRARKEAYPKREENKLLPGFTRELEDAMVRFSEPIPPNREHYDVERLYDEPEANISLNTENIERNESKKT